MLFAGFQIAYMIWGNDRFSCRILIQHIQTINRRLKLNAHPTPTGVEPKEIDRFKPLQQRMYLISYPDWKGFTVLHVIVFLYNVY